MSTGDHAKRFLAAVSTGIEVEVVVRGLSMWPLFRTGTRIYVVALDGPIRRGDVVLFPDEERFVAHRVVRTDGELVVTRGDGCRHEDLPHPRSALIGRVTKMKRGGRTMRLDSAVGALLSSASARVGPLRALAQELKRIATSR